MSAFPPPPPDQGGWGAPVGPYGYSAGAQAAQMKPLRGLSTALTVLLALAGVAALLLAGAMFNRASVSADLAPFISTPDVLQRHDDATGTFAGMLVLYVLLVLAAGVVFIVWQFRHAANAQARRGSLGLGPGWAIGGWFIPVANYVLPAIQLHQSARASDPETGPGPSPGSGGRAPGVIIAWALAYALGNIVFAVGVAIYSSGIDEMGFVNDPDAMTTGDRLGATGMLIVAAAAVLAILMVRKLSARQADAFERDGGGQGAAGPTGHGQPTQWSSAPQGGQGYAPPQAQGYPPPPQSPPAPPPPPRGDDEAGWGAPT